MPRGDTAGLSGSTAYSDADGSTQYVCGDVLLDGPDLDDVLDEPDGEAQVRGVVLHELGDVAGLALMGSRSCVNDLSGPTSG